MIVKLLCAPVLMGVAVIEDALTLLPRRAMGDDSPSATQRAYEAITR
jgi:hypothetical protein